MTPEQILSDFSNREEGFPREAMVAAGANRDAMIPIFLNLIDRLRSDEPEAFTDADVSACICIYFLLGEWRDPRAYRPLTTLLRQDPEFVDFLLGDAVTEATARVIAGVCDGDLTPIFSTIEDQDADEFVRSQMIDALVMIARQRQELLPEVVTFLESFPSAENDKSEIVYGSWAFAVADLGLANLEQQVREAFERKWISPEEASFDFFQKQLRMALEGGESPWYQNSRNTRPIKSAIDEMSDWYCFSETLFRDQQMHPAQGSTLPQFSGASFERESPKVGRNEPCPCGSGRKFKKCCLH